MASKNKDKKPYLGSTVSPEVAALLKEETKITGNQSFIVEKALRLYFGLTQTPEDNTQLKAS